MKGNRITPLKSERIQLPVPTDPELAALWAGLLAALAEAHGRGPRFRTEGDAVDARLPSRGAGESEATEK